MVEAQFNYLFFTTIVSQLPGKSNPGQQVLIQGNQILHVARMLQGKGFFLTKLRKTCHVSESRYMYYLSFCR